MTTEKTKVLVCPKCQSEYVIRVNRPWPVKLFTSRRKFQCTDCAKVFYVDRSKTLLDLSLIQ